jgi:hypothetical protein
VSPSVVDRLVKDILAYAQSHHLRGDTALITDESLAKLREIVPLARDWERMRAWLERIASREVSPASAQDARWALEGVEAPRAALDLKETPE